MWYSHELGEHRSSELVLCHEPPPGAAEAQREAAEAWAWWNTEPMMQEGI
jgi:hypothetical protein